MPEDRLLADAAIPPERAQLRRLEYLSLAEATTLVLLVCIAVPLKYAYGWPMGSRILGPIHGMAFLAYGWAAVQTVAAGGWSLRESARLFAAALVPFGGYLNLPWLRRKADPVAR